MRDGIIRKSMQKVVPKRGVQITIDCIDKSSNPDVKTPVSRYGRKRLQYTGHLTWTAGSSS